MALQSNFFGNNKRDGDTPMARPLGSPGASTMAIPSSSSSAATVTAVRDTPPAGAPIAVGAADTSQRAESPSKLTVGPNIKLKGVEITDCDTLVVEGLVEATMDSRVIRIAEQGAFKGSADIDIAEIHGVFDGDLHARQKLVIYATGRVSGKVRYGSVVIEEGGQLGGEIQCTPTGANSPPKLERVVAA